MHELNSSIIINHTSISVLVQLSTVFFCHQLLTTWFMDNLSITASGLLWILDFEVLSTTVRGLRNTVLSQHSLGRTPGTKEFYVIWQRIGLSWRSQHDFCTFHAKPAQGKGRPSSPLQQRTCRVTTPAAPTSTPVIFF